ncbi:degenerin-like protein unc-105 [Physella acuta]|uniref:degenerin-like protein unc-105 n=1 Tax=Physella acuta TaxID=109671 RepID=UPI0027DAC252|nr:degenerin-like protein unc-105 [Physella acuta]
MEVDTFLAKYKRKYTRNTCQKICKQNLIRTRCNCSDSLQPELNQLMGNVQKLNICMSSAEQKCVANISMSFEPNDAGCGCDNPCSERIYEKTISSRRWPSPDFGKILLEGACKNQEDDVCAPLRADEQLLVKNFIKVNIFFQDLNFEQLEENPDYGSTQLLSDIGGSIGLWIGLSVLGLCELLHLAVSIVVYICCGRHAKK